MSRGPDGAKRAAWQVRLREFDRGKLTVAQFCRRAGVSVAAFYQWRRKLKSAAAADVSGAARGRTVQELRFLPVEITGSSSVEAWLPGGARLMVPGRDHAAIRTVLAVLLGVAPLDPRAETGAC